MVDACKLLGVDVMTAHWEFTLGAKRVQEIIEQGLQGQHRVRRPERQDHRFRGSGVRVARDARRSTACRWRSSARLSRTRRSPTRATWCPTGPSASRTTACRRSSTRCARKGAQVVVVLSHNGMDVDLKMASRVTGIDAILGGHTHDGVPQPVIVHNATGAHAGDQRRLQRQVPRRARFRRQRRAGSPTSAIGCCRCSRTCCRPIRQMQALIDRVRAPFKAQARRAARGHRGAAVSARQLQRQLRPADPRRADGGQGRADRVLARVPLGHQRAARVRRSRANC